MKTIFNIALLTLLSTGAMAQEEGTTNTDKKSGTYISISGDGVNVGKDKTDAEKKKKKEEKKFKFMYGVVDLGLNNLKDKTDYTNPETQAFLNVGNDEIKNENLFSLREGKSINVNIYPITGAYRMVNTKSQKMYISMGVGLQIYNFRFNKPITYINETKPMIVMNDSVSLSKNKLAVQYLSIPLAITAKTRLAKETWLVYGAGITGGYRLSSWTKQKSDEFGKQKNRDPFNLNNFNSCVTAEFGIDGIFRLYASYQLTSLHKDALDQHPYAIGLRFGGA